MIIGHTPQYYHHGVGINKTCGSKLWRVDTGSSKAFDMFDKAYRETGKITEYRKSQVLEILNDKVYTLKPADDVFHNAK